MDFHAGRPVADQAEREHDKKYLGDSQVALQPAFDGGLGHINTIPQGKCVFNGGLSHLTGQIDLIAAACRRRPRVERNLPRLGRAPLGQPHRLTATQAKRGGQREELQHIQPTGTAFRCG